ncbi:Endocuticle structural glycoprotein SgAbd-1 [Gryllus bimaculatus]|nr:Endocuticle structural glycoprotein SgAbd-1 [Gryllus bimaculatus]
MRCRRPRAPPPRDPRPAARRRPRPTAPRPAPTAVVVSTTARPWARRARPLRDGLGGGIGTAGGRLRARAGSGPGGRRSERPEEAACPRRRLRGPGGQRGGACAAGSRGGGAGAGASGLGALVAADRPAPITVTGTLRSGTGSAEARNNQGGHWVILRQSNNVEQNGYLWDVETENGIGAREQGALQNPGTDAEAMLAQGYYEWTGPDGILYRVDYTADAGGFRAEGAHLPTPPPIPEAILRALDYIAAHPEENEGERGRAGPGGRFRRK